jgi:hypothetical protein
MARCWVHVHLRRAEIEEITSTLLLLLCPRSCSVPVSLCVGVGWDPSSRYPSFAAAVHEAVCRTVCRPCLSALSKRIGAQVHSFAPRICLSSLLLRLLVGAQNLHSLCSKIGPWLFEIVCPMVVCSHITITSVSFNICSASCSNATSEPGRRSPPGVPCRAHSNSIPGC